MPPDPQTGCESHVGNFFCLGVGVGGGEAPRKRHKKRVIKKDPNKPRPPPWSQQELRCFRQFVNSIPGGPEQIGWPAVAKALGTNRSIKSLHTRWLRDQGRIVDGPRGGSAKK